MSHNFLSFNRTKWIQQCVLMENCIKLLFQCFYNRIVRVLLEFLKRRFYFYFFHFPLKITDLKLFFQLKFINFEFFGRLFKKYFLPIELLLCSLIFKSTIIDNLLRLSSWFFHFTHTVEVYTNEENDINVIIKMGFFFIYPFNFFADIKPTLLQKQTFSYQHYDFHGGRREIAFNRLRYYFVVCEYTRPTQTQTTCSVIILARMFVTNARKKKKKQTNPRTININYQRTLTRIFLRDTQGNGSADIMFARQ